MAFFLWHFFCVALIGRLLVAEIISDLEVLRFMPSPQMQNGLANGAVIHRVNYPFRNIYGGDRSVYGDVARTYDEAILAVPRRLAGTP